MKVFWAILYDPISSRNIAVVAYDADTGMVRCASAREELKQALEESSPRTDEMKTRKTSGLVVISTVQVSDGHRAIDSIVTPYLNPLRIGSRGMITDTTLELTIQKLSPYVDNLYSETKQ